MAKRGWRPEHERLRQEILAMLATGRDRPPFAGLEPAELDALRRAPFGEWCHTFLPDWFTVADAPFHAEMDKLRNTVGTPVGVCQFGGAGKTVRYTVAWTLYLVCHGLWVCDLQDGSRVVLPTHDAEERADVVEKTRIVLHVIGCRNERKASEHLDVIRIFLKSSSELRAAYGDGIAPSDGQDSEKDCQANGVRMLAMGIAQSLRGTLHAGHRVQSIIWDDVENNEIAASKEREDKLADQIFGDWIPRCEGAGDRAVMVMVMNQYRSRHCQARRWRQMSEESRDGKPRVIFDVQPLDDGAFHSTWPALYPDEQCRRIAFRVGTTRYNVEFRCREVNEDCRINPEWFQPFRVAAVSPSERAKMRFVAALDPNHKAGETNDPSAWVVMAGYPNRRGKFLFHAWLQSTATRRQIIQHQWWIEDAFPGVHLVMEDEAITESYRELLHLMCREAARPCRVPRGVPHSGNKQDRILTDDGEIERGEWHVDVTEGDQGVVVDQYGDVGSGKGHDDGPDAAEMASSKLDEMLFSVGYDYQGSARPGRGALVGLGDRRREPPPMPGSLDERWERQMNPNRESELAVGAGRIPW